MNARATWRLSGMMALVYAMQGAWWPLLASHLADCNIQGSSRGWIFATLAIAATAMPLGAGRLVDRLMPTQRYLGLAYGLTSVLLVLVATGRVAGTFGFFGLFLVYWLITAPCAGLAASLAMRNLPRPGEQFAGVRLWGTVGWMVSGWLVSALMAVTGAGTAGQGVALAFWIGAGLSVVLSIYSLTILPHTPPLDTDSAPTRALGQALDLLREPGVGQFLAIAFGVNLTVPFIYQVMPTHMEALGLPRSWVSTAMSLGQIPEILGLAVLPWVLGRFGYKITLAAGILAWAARYLSLAANPPLWLAVAGIPLHGIGSACFTIGGQVYMDAKAPAHRRATAQSLYMVATNGMGTLLGSLVGGQVAQALPAGDPRIFIIPCVINLAIAAYTLGCFPRKAAGPAEALEPADVIPLPRIALERLQPAPAELGIELRAASA